MENNYLESAIKQFLYYKSLGEKAMQQVSDEDLFRMYHADTNSIAIIVKHLWGNMLSRWTDFLTTDGEKDWRARDAEFENDPLSRDALLQKWEEGWQVLFDALHTRYAHRNLRLIPMHAPRRNVELLYGGLFKLATQVELALVQYRIKNAPFA